MPYIPQAERADFINFRRAPNTLGALNYAITLLLMEWLEGRELSYETYNNMVGVLECTKQELYRRMIAPYEDFKCKENGDVYRDGGGI